MLGAATNYIFIRDKEKYHLISMVVFWARLVRRGPQHLTWQYLNAVLCGLAQNIRLIIRGGREFFAPGSGDAQFTIPPDTIHATT
ncbi:MAG: hypothetical protein AAFR90_05685 [Pseudomonadota bacterium]